MRTPPQFGNLRIHDRPPPLRVPPQVEHCLYALDLVLDHGLRPGAVYLEAQDAEVRLCTHLSVGNDSQGLTEPRWCDTRLQQVIRDHQRYSAWRLWMEVRSERRVLDDQFEHRPWHERLRLLKTHSHQHLASHRSHDGHWIRSPELAGRHGILFRQSSTSRAQRSSSRHSP